jgi:hypothetical protein
VGDGGEWIDSEVTVKTVGTISAGIALVSDQIDASSRPQRYQPRNSR